MTERDALLAAILSSPGDDTPRLIYADWCEENGEVERANFVRCQVERAGIKCEQCKSRGTYSLRAAGGFGQRGIPCEKCGAYRILLRELEIWNESRLNGAPHPWFGQMGFRHTANWLTSHDKPEMRIPLGRNRERWVEFRIDRGFVSFITISWSDFLRHHAALIWSPRQTVECQKCQGFGMVQQRPQQATFCECAIGEGSTPGRIPRPFVPTAQPITAVIITTTNGQVPTIEQWERPWDRIMFRGDKAGVEYWFDRVKCGVCGGRGITVRSGQYLSTCPSCHGRPLNRWECEAWPRIHFTMPQERPFGIVESVNLDGTVNVRVGLMV